MKKLAKIILLGSILLMLLMPTPINAMEQQTPIPIVEIIRTAVTKVIKAIDLKIQRLQNKTIWLQNAQKTIENTLSKLKLDEVSNWSKQYKELYQNYFEELRKVKAAISYYQRIKEVTEIQKNMVKEYQHIWGLLQKDNHFTTEEVQYMAEVYSGMLDTSLTNLDQIFLVLRAFTTQMSDAKRLDFLNKAADNIEECYFDLKRFNQHNIFLSIQRSKNQKEIDQLKKLYGVTKQ